MSCRRSNVKRREVLLICCWVSLGGQIIKSRWLVVYLFFVLFFEQTERTMILESWGKKLEDNLEWKRCKDPEP